MKIVFAIFVSFFISSDKFAETTLAIGQVCDPSVSWPRCGENAACFVASKFCRLGHCACISRLYQPYLSEKRKGDCGRVLEEGEYCANVDPGLLPENGYCFRDQESSIVVTFQVSISIPVQFGEPCNLTIDEGIGGHCSEQRGLTCNEHNVCVCLPNYWPSLLERSNCKPASIGDYCDLEHDCDGEYKLLGVESRSYCNLTENKCRCNASDMYHPVSYYEYAPRDSVHDDGISGLRLQIGTWCYRGFPGRANLGDMCLRPLIDQRTQVGSIASPSMCRPEYLCYSCPEDAGDDESIGHCVKMPEEGSGYKAFFHGPTTTAKTRPTVTMATLATNNVTELVAENNATASSSVVSMNTTTVKTTRAEYTLGPVSTFEYDPVLAALAMRTGYFHKVVLHLNQFEDETTETPAASYVTETSTIDVMAVNGSNLTSTTTTTTEEQKIAVIEDENLIYEYGFVY